MVIGNGMIATAFSKYKDDENVIIFASGVSNSKENKPDAFKREFDLLKKYVNIKAKIVYFSTTSIEGESLMHSYYVKHKIHMESFIKENFDNFLIFRLPIVIGKTNNVNTFFNAIKNKIKSKELIEIKKDASIHIIDVEDLVNILPVLIVEEHNITINICFNNRIKVTDIVSMMENILKTKSNKKIVDGGSTFEALDDRFMRYVKKNSIGRKKTYNESILKKYLNEQLK